MSQWPLRIRPFRNVNELEDRLVLRSFSQRLIDNRSRFQIAVVDDESFGPLDVLRRHNFTIQHLRDVSSIDQLIRYHIVLCDLVGVGLELHPTLQGAQIISEVKKSYPEKVLVAYTGGGHKELIEKSLQFSDYYLPKDAGIEDWCRILDEAIRDLANPATVWRKFRHRLLDAGVTPYQLAQIEDRFVRKSLAGKEFSVQDMEKEADRLHIPNVAKSLIAHFIVHAVFEMAKEHMRASP